MNRFSKINISRSEHKTIDPFLQNIKSIKTHLDTCNKSYSQLTAKKYPDNASDYFKLYENIAKITKILQRMAFYYDSSDTQPVSPTVLHEMDISFVKNFPNIIQFRMHHLLPHNITIDTSTGKQRYLYDRSQLAASYRTDLSAFLKKNDIPLYQKPVMIWFRCLFPKNESMIVDPDNLDPKVFIDTCVNKIFVKDDNIKQVHYMFSGEEQENICVPYTIAYVGPENTVLDFLIRKKREME